MEFNDYLDKIPNLHTWDQGKTWNSGGFQNYHLKFFYELASKTVDHDLTILETGAGNSTIAFLLAKPGKLISIAPNQSLFDRIFAFINENQIKSDPLEIIVDRSEWALPELAKSGLHLDIVLIDGGHNWPTVFVDFCYTYFMLHENGLMIIDDVNLHSIKELARFLYSDKKHFSLIHDLGKSLVFRKLTNNKFLPEWNQQPYIKKKTDIYTASGKPFDLFP